MLDALGVRRRAAGLQAAPQAVSPTTSTDRTRRSIVRYETFRHGAAAST